ncbi:MAG: secondary thiamine-phosphate synthase enzyme YjbQ [bacterium]
MAVAIYSIKVKTKGECDIVNLTDAVAEVVAKSELKNGMVLTFVPGSTGGITTIEYEPGLLQDLPALYQKLIPKGPAYEHDQTWGDGNGFSHLRAALTGASFTCPLAEGRLLLGTWQQIVLLDFDNRPRNREIVVQIVGE